MRETLSERQLQIMKILWENEDGMVASEIFHALDGVGMSTVQATIRSLLKKNYVEVGSIVTSGTVLARKYIPVLQKEAYYEMQIWLTGGLMEAAERIISGCSDIDMLDSFLEMIRERKKELKKEPKTEK